MENGTHLARYSPTSYTAGRNAVGETIIHESVHVYAIAHDIKDTAKSGRHNKEFQRLAIEFGLTVKTDDGKALDSYGFGYTSLSPELEAQLYESFQPDEAAFGLYRQVTRNSVAGPPLWECMGCDPAQKGPHKGKPTDGSDRTGRQAFRAICADCMTPFTAVVTYGTTDIGEENYETHLYMY